MAGKGILSFTVWPNHLGAITADGTEPLDHPDYQRGQISWGLNEQGRIVGHATVHVPRGTLDWTHVLYCHNPQTPGCITVQKLSHPFRLPQGGVIRLLDITDEDVRPFNPDKVLHD